MSSFVIFRRYHVLVDVLEECRDAVLREDRQVLDLPALARDLRLVEDRVFLEIFEPGQL